MDKEKNVELEQKKCDFCNSDDGEKLIQGKNAYICNECIKLCSDLIEEFQDDDDIDNENIEVPLPKELKEHLDKYIIGQERAKKQVCTAVYNHYKRITRLNKKGKKSKVELQKSNVLLLGPTGSGKTLIAKTIAEYLNVPFAIGDATTLTQAGYVGEDPENILLKLIQNADYDIEKAEKGIIYIDEIDKIAMKQENVSISRDVSGEGVQQALLKILEGTISRVPPQGGRKHPNQEAFEIDTTNILFIVGGAFSGLDKIINNRLGKNRIGITPTEEKKSKSCDKEIFKYANSQDIIKYGFLAEFVGRLPVIAKLNKLEVEEMLNILTEPKNALTKQYQELFKYDNIKLTFSKDSLKLIAAKCIDKNIGARGLRGLIEEILEDAMFELPGTDCEKFVVSKELTEEVLNRVI